MSGPDDWGGGTISVALNGRVVGARGADRLRCVCARPRLRKVERVCRHRQGRARWRGVVWRDGVSLPIVKNLDSRRVDLVVKDGRVIHAWSVSKRRRLHGVHYQRRSAEPAWLLELMTCSEMFRRAFPDGSPVSNQRTDPAIPRTWSCGSAALDPPRSPRWRALIAQESRTQRYPVQPGTLPVGWQLFGLLPVTDVDERVTVPSTLAIPPPPRVAVLLVTLLWFSVT